MIWVLAGMIVVAEAAKLGNTYLPPPTSAKESGGSDGALQLPLEPPYIDQYNPSEQKPEAWRPGTRILKKDGKGSATSDNKFLENEDEVTIPTLEKGRFISGSYSYTGPNNVLVTVTYKAGDRQERKEDEDVQITDDNVAEEDAETEAEAEEEVVNDEEQQEDDDLIVPTPPSLPAELARAFDFHRNKQLAEEAKTNRTKKPIRKTIKHKLSEKHGLHGANNNYGSGNQASSNYEGQYGQKIPGHLHGHKQGITGPAYQYPPPHQYGPPTINQGYSYPKAS